MYLSFYKLYYLQIFWHNEFLKNQIRFQKKSETDTADESVNNDLKNNK